MILALGKYILRKKKKIPQEKITTLSQGKNSCTKHQEYYSTYTININYAS